MYVLLKDAEEYAEIVAVFAPFSQCQPNLQSLNAGVVMYRHDGSTKRIDSVQ